MDGKIDEIESKKAKEEIKLTMTEVEDRPAIAGDSEKKPTEPVKQPKETKVQRSKITSYGEYKRGDLRSLAQ